MKKERILDRVYKEFEAKYKDMPEEEMQKEIEAREKEIKGKEASLEKLEGEPKEKLSKDIEQAKKRLENLRGYNKNKTQIAAIIKYREQLSSKLQQTMTQRDESKKMYDTAKKNYAEATKELADEKHTMEMDQNEYNELLQRQADAKKDMQEQLQTFLKSRDKVLELQTKIGKCNLAWKTLFVNKTWDDIQKISMQDGKRLTRKVNPDEKIMSRRDKEKAIEEPRMTVEERKIQEGIGKNVKQMIEENKTKALVEVKSKNPFKRLWNNIIKWVRGEEKAKQVPTSEKEQPEEKIDVSASQRDQFLEGLRMHVDKEYRETVKAEKDVKYKEAHEVKPKEESR